MCRLLFIWPGKVPYDSDDTRIRKSEIPKELGYPKYESDWTIPKLVDMTKRIPAGRFVFFWFCLVILVGLLISLTLSKKDEMKIFLWFS